ncbi:MAG: hypothetical protein RLZZ501_1101 [Pseudomonadota bacterium]
MVLATRSVMMLDSRTVFFLVAVSAVLASAALALVNRRGLPVPGVRLWTVGNAIGAVGLMLSVARAALPELFGIVLANILLVLAMSCQIAGCRQFVGRPGRLGLGLALTAAIAAEAAWFTFVQPSIAVRVVAISLLFALLCGAGAWALLRPGLKPALPLRCYGGLYLALAVFFMVRAVMAWDVAIPDYFASGPIALSAHLAGFVQLVLGTFLQLVLIAEWLVADIARQASLDPLTGLLNRRAFAAIAGKLLAAAGRSGRPVALLMLDLDHFKRANDSRGHAFGDELLCRFARVAERELRAGDVICRHGGEEFAALLPDADPDQALLVADRLRRAFAEDSCAAEVRATVSVGIAACDLGDGLDGLLRRADRALYRAKNEGRDRCVLGG